MNPMVPDRPRPRRQDGAAGRRPESGSAQVRGPGVGESGDRRRVAAGNPRLLELLVKENRLTAEQAQTAAAEQRRTGERSASVLRRLGLLKEDDLLDFLSRTYGLPVMNLQRLEVVPETTKLVKKEIVQRHRVFPVRKVDKVLTLALADPTVLHAIDDVQFATGLHVVPVLASETEITAAIETHYGDNTQKMEEMFKTDPKAVTDVFEVIDRSQKMDIDDLEERATQAPIIRNVNLIIAEAIRRRASDIHFEPDEEVFQVLYRIDGVLHDVMTVPKHMEAPMLSRVKVMAKMDIAERRLPQDGRITVQFSTKEVDIRVSSVPTVFGEKIVLRILDKSAVVLDLAKLGFEEDDLERFRQAVRAPYGMIVITGPTGCGKSTTLYAAVSAINSPEINIMTAEDPVEYNLRRVNQLHVREDIGLSFTTALRSFLRQDPDVILVGEMRDPETAQIATRAALTGHLVFSTLHTNDAPSTVIRLIDMGIAPFLVSSCLMMVVAQRLCRRICLECRESTEVPVSALLDAGFRPEEVETVKLYKGSGCPSCANTGYRGRTAIHEMLSVTGEVQNAIVQRRSANEIREIAIKQGMRTLRDAGLRKMARGITTFEEVMRATFAH